MSLKKPGAGDCAYNEKKPVNPFAHHFIGCNARKVQRQSPTLKGLVKAKVGCDMYLRIVGLLLHHQGRLADVKLQFLLRFAAHKLLLPRQTLL